MKKFLALAICCVASTVNAQGPPPPATLEVAVWGTLEGWSAPLYQPTKVNIWFSAAVPVGEAYDVQVFVEADSDGGTVFVPIYTGVVQAGNHMHDTGYTAVTPFYGYDLLAQQYYHWVKGHIVASDLITGVIEADDDEQIDYYPPIPGF